MADDVVVGTVYRMVGRALSKRGMASLDEDVWEMIALVVSRLEAPPGTDRQLTLPGVLDGQRGLGREEGVVREVLEWAEAEEWLPGVLAAKLRIPV